MNNAGKVWRENCLVLGLKYTEMIPVERMASSYKAAAAVLITLFLLQSANSGNVFKMHNSLQNVS